MSASLVPGLLHDIDLFLVQATTRKAVETALPDPSIADELALQVAWIGEYLRLPNDTIDQGMFLTRLAACLADIEFRARVAEAGVMAIVGENPCA